jgi:transposase
MANRKMGRSRKKAREEKRTIVFVDEAGFYLLPAIVKTYAPRGQTPILKVPLSWDHLSVICAITPDGKLYIMIQDRAFKGPDIVRFLRHLLCHVPGKLLIIWDGLPAHHGQVVKEFLRQGAAKRIHLERLPGYAPDLNPVEGVFHYLKYVELRNLCCQSLPILRDELGKAVARLRHKTDVILGCIHHVHLGDPNFSSLC